MAGTEHVRALDTLTVYLLNYFEHVTDDLWTAVARRNEARWRTGLLDVNSWDADILEQEANALRRECADVDALVASIGLTTPVTSVLFEFMCHMVRHPTVRNREFWDRYGHSDRMSFTKMMLRVVSRHFLTITNPTSGAPQREAQGFAPFVVKASDSVSNIGSAATPPQPHSAPKIRQKAAKQLAAAAAAPPPPPLPHESASVGVDTETDAADEATDPGRDESEREPGHAVSEGVVSNDTLDEPQPCGEDRNTGDASYTSRRTAVSTRSERFPRAQTAILREKIESERFPSVGGVSEIHQQYADSAFAFRDADLNSQYSRSRA